MCSFPEMVKYNYPYLYSMHVSIINAPTYLRAYIGGSYSMFAFTGQLGWLKRSHLRSKCY